MTAEILEFKPYTKEQVIGILRNGLNMNGVSSFVQQIIIGLVILLTVWIDQKRNRR